MPKKIPGAHFARHLIERRTLIFQLVKRDFQHRYIGSAAGWLWGLIHPLVLLGSYVFVFDFCLHQTPGPGAVTTNFPMLVFSGMLPWLLFSETVQRSAGCLIEQANLITKTVFPAEIVPVSIFLSSLISHLLALVLVISGAALFLKHITPLLAILPVVMLLVGLFAVGIGWIAAALHVYLRDTAQVLAVLLTLSGFMPHRLFLRKTSSAALVGVCAPSESADLHRTCVPPDSPRPHSARNRSGTGGSVRLSRIPLRRTASSAI